MNKHRVIQFFAWIFLGAVFIFGGMYIFAELRMNSDITAAVDDMDKAYYKGIVSTCFKKDRSEYKCCIASVYAMREVNGTAISSDRSCTGQTNQLRCPGSFVWCENK